MKGLSVTYNMRHYNEMSTQEFNTKLKRVEQAEGKGVPHPGKGRPSLWLPGPLSPRREKAHRTPGEGARASGCLNHSGWGRPNTQVQPNPRFCGGPENWNRTERRDRSI